MNKQELINNVSEKSELSKKDTTLAIEAMLEVITETLASGDSVKIQGFGNFSVTETAERNGRNPSTGETLVIPAGKKPKFKAGEKLKVSVNA